MVDEGEENNGRHRESDSGLGPTTGSGEES